VILVVGVNGAGKTTTIGKLAKSFHNSAVNPEPSFCLDLVKRCFKEIDLLSMLDLSFLKKLNIIIMQC
jgi:uridine kinase